MADSESLLSDERVYWAHHPTTRNAVNAVRNLFLAFRVLRAERPSILVSDGAGVAFPFFVAAKALGIKTVYVEVYDRLDSATLTGRLCRPIADRVLLQWEEQLEYYPDGQVIGPLL
jgi:UDP-N-acetylglucosamine:LPS N-acetylglucosamine transferase